MSGICGMFHTQNNEPDVRLFMKLLAGNMYRGTDKVQHGSSDYIRFGYAGNCITRESLDEVQPLTSDGVTMVADLRLDRRQELVRALKEFGMSATLQEPDVSLFLKAYLVWDWKFVNKVDGEFAFALWDSRMKSLVCGKDHLGLRPFFYKWDGQEFLFSSTLEALVSTIGTDSGDWNRDYFLEFIVKEGMVDGFATPYKNLYRLSGAHLLMIQGNQLKISRYWDIAEVPDIRMKDDATYVENFKDIFFQSVKDRMRSTTPVSVAMSGGLDSTSIFTAGVVQNPEISRKDFFPVSWVFDKFPSSDERELIQYITKQYGIDTYPVVADDLWAFKNFPNDSPLTAEPFVNSAVDLFNRSLYEKSRALGARVLLGGAGGDEALSGSHKVISDYIWTLKWNKAYQDVKDLATARQEPFLKNLMQYGILPLFERNSGPQWLSEEVRKLLIEVRAPRGLIARKRQEKQIQHLTNRYFDQHVAAPLGMEARYPFLDRRLIEFMLGIPMEQKLMGSLKKVVLRRSMKGILPEVIRRRVNKTSHYPIFYQGLQKEWPKLAEALNRGYLSDLGLVDHQKYMNDVLLWRQGDTRSVDILWTMIGLELWLHKQESKQTGSNSTYVYAAASGDFS